MSRYLWDMFVRKKHNKSGSISVQIIDKTSGKYRVIHTVGSSSDPCEVEYLWRKAYAMIPSFSGQMSLSFFSESTNNLIQTLRDVQTDQIQVDGPEKVFGKIFDEISFGRIKQDLFRHLVITRLVYPRRSSMGFFIPVTGLRY